MKNKKYEPWTQEADNELRRLVGSGQSINELASHFGRSESAISSRIRYLGLNAAKSQSQQSSKKPQNTIKMNITIFDLYVHPIHGRVRKHFATGLEISEDGQFIEKRYSDPHTGDAKSFSPKVIKDTNGKEYIKWSDKKVYIDEMVCSCFHGKRKDGPMEAPVHIDGNLSNNHASNLRWQ